MGKNFEKELANLDMVYDSAFCADVNGISKFLAEFSSSYLFGVGSGGSYSVAAAMDFMCKNAGILSRCITPLELCDLIKTIKQSAFMLFTASGSNNDTKNSYRFISDLEPKGLLTCCMHKNAPIKKIQRNNIHEWYFEYKMPVQKDGYLAVESYVSTIIILAKAFQKIRKDGYFALPENRKWGQANIEKLLLAKVLLKKSIILLHSGITTPAAVDLESKFSEGALGYVSTVDFRNFAHGRHFWLAKNREETAVIALVGKRERKLADKTLVLIPPEIPVLRKDVDDSTIEGLFDIIDYELKLVSEAGIIQNMDPGKPHIEEFGRKMYHINYNLNMLPENRSLKNDRLAMGIYRKGNGTLDAARKAYNELCFREYKALVFDYDGTLHDKRFSDETNESEKCIFNKINDLLKNGVTIGIATGRGKSVRRELQKVIKPEYWNNVLISYYNGGVTGLLADEKQPDKFAAPVPVAFSRVNEYLQESFLDEDYELDGIRDQNPYQLTMISPVVGIVEGLKKYLDEIPDIKIVQSSHSIDIIPKSSSKNNIFNGLRSLGIDENEVLCIGDAGHAGGNDYELLNRWNALSVDSVSNQPQVCWNFASMGNRNLDATNEYLGWINIVDFGKFMLREQT